MRVWMPGRPGRAMTAGVPVRQAECSPAIGEGSIRTGGRVRWAVGGSNSGQVRGRPGHGRLTGRRRSTNAATTGVGRALGRKSSSMMARRSLTLAPSSQDHPGDGMSPAQAPLPSSLLPMRRTFEEFAEHFMIFRVPGAAWRLPFAVSDRMPRIGEERRPWRGTSPPGDRIGASDGTSVATADGVAGRRAFQALRAVRCGQYHGAAPTVLTGPRPEGAADGTMAACSTRRAHRIRLQAVSPPGFASSSATPSSAKRPGDWSAHVSRSRSWRD